jgi:hypothetical protein
MKFYPQKANVLGNYILNLKSNNDFLCLLQCENCRKQVRAACPSSQII